MPDSNSMTAMARAACLAIRSGPAHLHAASSVARCHRG